MIGSSSALQPAGGWLGQLDPRLRIGAGLLFALTTIGLHQAASILLALVSALALALTTEICWSVLMRRLLVLESLLIVLLISLPFSTPGPCILVWGDVCASQTGLELAAVLLLKVSTVMIAMAVLIGTLDPATLGHALGQLGMPDRLTQLVLLTIRQIHLSQAEFARLQQAIRARAFVPRPDLHTWRTYGWLIGMLLVRSHRRAQRLLEAMRCRGFRGRFYLLVPGHWDIRDTLAALLLPWPLLALYWLDTHLGWAPR